MMSVVGVVGVVVVVVVVVGGGGEQLLYMDPPRAHVWFSKIQKKFPIFLFFKSPCLDQLPMYGG